MVEIYDVFIYVIMNIDALIVWYMRNACCDIWLMDDWGWIDGWYHVDGEYDVDYV